MRKSAILAADLCWVVVSAFLAVFIRDNFIVDPARLAEIVPYAAIAVSVAAVVFLGARLSDSLWRYTSLSDVLRIVSAVTIALLLTLFVSFVLNRLEGVARSVPVIQWLLLVAGMIGSRVVFRVWHDHANRRAWTDKNTSDQHALIVGVSHLTELYLEAVAEYASRTFHIVGLLTDRSELHGRLLHRQKILGKPEKLLAVMRQLEVHGVLLDRVLVMQSVEQLSLGGREAVLAVERAGNVKVDWLVERLGLTNATASADGPEPELSSEASNLVRNQQGEQLPPWLGNHYAKRIFDIAIVLMLAPLLVPLGTMVALIVALDVGLPVVFWQQRPGRHGRTFKLFKFRTMRAAHDAVGNRRPDEERSSGLGRLLRRTKLDELPQFYNVLIGEMSLVGPRPLLPQDQPNDVGARLAAQPGVTGFAQVNGGPDISADDKNALDLWYMESASLWLDIKILFHTMIILIVGEHTDEAVLSAARARVAHARTQNTDWEAQSHLSRSAEGSALVATAGPSK